MKPERFLDALGDIPQEYLDDLARWQTAETPLPEEAARQSGTAPELQDPERNMEAITVKQNKREINVRKLAPVTAAIFAGLAACAALALHLGNRPTETPEISPAASVSAEVTELQTAPPEEPVQVPDAPEYLGYATLYGAFHPVPEDNLHLPEDATAVFGLLHSPEEAQRFFKSLGSSEDALFGAVKEFDYDGACQLVFGVHETPGEHMTTLRSVSVTSDHELLINLNTYRNTTWNEPASECFYVISIVGELPETDKFRLTYTVYDSDASYGGMPETDIEDAMRQEPVFMQMQADTLRQSPVYLLPDDALIPQTTVILYADRALAKTRACVYNVDGSAESWLSPEDPWMTDELRNRVSACIDCNHTVLGVFGSRPSPNALTRLYGLWLDPEGVLTGTLYSKTADGTEEEAAFAELLIFDTPVQNLDVKMLQLETGTESIEILPVLRRTEAAPAPVALAVVTDVPAEQETGTDTRMTEAVEVPVAVIEEAALLEGYLRSPDEAPESAALSDSTQWVKAAFSNAFLAESLHLWIRPTEEEAAKFAELAAAMDPAEYGDEVPEWTGGGFLLQLCRADGTAVRYEFLEDGFVIVTEIGKDGISTEEEIRRDKTGKAQELLLAIQDAQIAREEEIQVMIESSRPVTPESVIPAPEGPVRQYDYPEDGGLPVTEEAEAAPENAVG